MSTVTSDAVKTIVLVSVRVVISVDCSLTAFMFTTLVNFITVAAVMIVIIISREVHLHM